MSDEKDSKKCKVHKGLNLKDVPDCVKLSFINSWNEFVSSNSESFNWETVKRIFGKDDRYVYILGAVIVAPLTLYIIMLLLVKTLRKLTSK